jgi:Tfp pilus assembly protein PilV
MYYSLLGFSLIEVLISLLLLSFILLGFDATEMYSVRAIRAAYYFDVATNQLNNMYERLRMLGADDDVSSQIIMWNKENQIVLPQGRGQVLGHFPDYTIIVYWGNIPMCTHNQLGNSGCINQHLIF